MRTGIMVAGACVLIFGMILGVVGVFLMEYTENISLEIPLVGSIELPIPGHPYAEIGKWIFIISMILEPIGTITMIVGGTAKSKQPDVQSPYLQQYNTNMATPPQIQIPPQYTNQFPYQHQPQYIPPPQVQSQLVPQTQPFYCSGCGQQLGANDKLCNKCGTPKPSR